MAPRREPARNNQQIYLVTFTTAERTPFFRHERWLLLLLNLLERHAAEFSLHDYVVMPDHVHLLLAFLGPLERAAQLVKGGFSYQAKRQLSWSGKIWQEGFYDHRIRDAHDYEEHQRYIATNVLTLPELLREQGGRHGSVSGLSLQPTPQRLRPHTQRTINGGTEVPPCQSTDAAWGSAGALSQSVAPLKANTASLQAQQNTVEGQR